jgi:hypothetical protein
LSSSQNEHITRAIVEMVVLDYMPLKLVEGKGFINLMSILAQCSQNIRTEGPFHLSLVAIGPVVSEEKIKM